MYIGREFKPFDWYGWIMALFGCVVMYQTISEKQYVIFLAALFVFIQYVWRVCFGRIYKIVYYDTLLHNMYQISVDDKIFYICSHNEEELALYMEAHYPNLEYRIIDQHLVESYIKREHFQ